MFQTLLCILLAWTCCARVSLAFVNLCTGATRAVTCAVGTPSYVILNNALTIQNCQFISCPSIDLDGASTLTLRNVTFQNGVDSNAFIRVLATSTAANLYLNSSSFLGNANTIGAVVIKAGNTKLIGNGLQFQDNAIPDDDTLNGGAIQVDTSTSTTVPITTIITLANCSFYNNQAVGSGGAIGLGTDSSVSISDTRFILNHAGVVGGAIVASSSGTRITMVRCLFDQNLSDTDGGSVHISGGAIITLMDRITFTNNVGTAYGACVNVEAHSCISNCVNSIFTDNNSAQGTALHIVGADSPDISCPTRVSNCTFLRNVNRENGNVRVASNAPASFDQCTFANNVGIYGGSFSIESSTLPFLVNITRSTFTGEVTSGYGGAIYLLDASLYMQDNVFTNCQVYGGQGGALCATASSPGVMNLAIDRCIFDSNQADLMGGAIEIQGNLNSFTISNTIGTNCTATEGGFLHTIQNGGAPPPEMTIYATNLTLRNNLGRVMGGDIRLIPGVSLVLSNSFLSGSNSMEGGAVAVEGPTTLNTVFRNVTFRGQFAIDGASVLVQTGPIKVQFDGCTFDSSISSLGSFVYLAGTGVWANISNSRFNNGLAYSMGGAIHAMNQVNFIMSNCILSGNSASYGGAISLATSSNATVSQSLFQANSALTYGGTIFLATSSRASISKCSFVKASAVRGGIVSAQESSAAMFSYCDFTNATATLFGGISYSTDSNTVVNCNYCSVYDVSVGSLGSVSYGENSASISFLNGMIRNQLVPTGSPLFSNEALSSLIVRNVSISGLIKAVDGTLLTLRNLATANFQGVSLTSVVATSRIGTILNIDTGSVATFNNAVMTDANAYVLFQLSGMGTQLVLQSCNIAWTRLVNGNTYGVTVLGGASLIWKDSQFVNYNGISVLEMYSQAKVQCLNSSITGSVLLSSPIQCNDGQFVGVSCQVRGCKVTGNLDSCAKDPSISVANGGALFVSPSCVASLNSSSILDSNSADFGGAIYSRGSVSLSGSVQITNNTAGTNGGAVYLDGPSAVLKLINTNGGNLVVRDNTAGKKETSSSFAYLSGQSGIILTGTSSSLSSVSGSVYLEDPRVATNSLINSVANVLPLVSFRSGATTLVSSIATGTVLNLVMGDSEIQTFTVTAYDAFGLAIVVDPSNLLLIQASAVRLTDQVTQSLSGETVKTIADPTSSSVSFSKLDIPGRVPGVTYRISLSVLNAVGSNSSSYFDVIYKDCDASSQSYVASVGCVPLQRINSSIKGVVTAICAILIVSILVGIVGLYKYREYHLIKANSSFFMTLGSVGGIIGLASGLLPVNSAANCAIINAFEGLGFVIVFGSISLKLYRIQAIFGQDSSGSKGGGARVMSVVVLKDEYLARYLGGMFIAMLIYQICWGIFGNPGPSATYISSLNVVVTDTCNSSGLFDIFMVAFKLFTTLTISYMAFQTRNVPSDYNEAKFIAFACYNWLVFGTLLSLLGKSVAVSPDTVYVMRELSLIISQSISSFILVLFKVWRCRFDPANTKDRVVTAMKFEVDSVNKSKNTSTFGGGAPMRSASVKKSSNVDGTMH